MEVIEKIHDINQEFLPTVIALGYFDGIHLGHQKLIKTTKKIALEENMKSAVFTFRTHPLSILSPEKAPKLLFSNEKKIQIIESLGIDCMIYPEFTCEIMNSMPEDFIENVLVKKFNVKHIVIGFNYKFGYKGLGTPLMLKKIGKKFGFDVTIIEPVKIDDTTISSTMIRRLIQSGEVASVEKYLGHPHSIIGKVVRGKGLGKKISIPTANIKIDKKIILPKSGVYHTIVLYKNKKYKAVTSVGYNPTFTNHPFTIESYILDFNIDIYNQEIEVFFLERIRPDIKFHSIDDLVLQIKKDIAFVENLNVNII